MKKQIRQITKPELNDAVELTPLQLNKISYEVKHSVVSPQQLMAKDTIAVDPSARGYD
ncbi:MAG: hypothetical protein NC111_07185 [Bacteroides sp.]|nr:hypothetical protein [Bacteroides sp.]MCM1414014.1 hypothetical protein [Bacteroides sp.]MCM1472291.1 hypothetical protein [Bacteroides sp.]